ncbi:MAG: hypothetical protein NVSMB26_19360 [Beijerinckiaceae bacterium]
MREVAINALQLRIVARKAQQMSAHRNKGPRAVRGTVEAAEQFLSSGLGGEMNVGRCNFRGAPSPFRNCSLQAGRIRSEILGERFKKEEPLLGSEHLVAVEYLAGGGRTGGLAATAEERLA